MGAQQRRLGGAEGILENPGELLPLCVLGKQSASRNLRLGGGREGHGNPI